MAMLRLGRLADDKPVRISIDLPAELHRDLVAYAALMDEHNDEAPVPPQKLVAPMLARFMADDREFMKDRRRAMPRAS